MPNYGYLVVEGPHDIEFVYRLLRPLGFSRIRLESELDPYFADLVPRTFPHDGDLQKRVPVPLFLQNATHVIAVHSALGDSRVVETIEENFAIIDAQELTGVGIILDTDQEIMATERYEALREKLVQRGYHFPPTPGTTGATSPKYGAFVLPDNVAHGNLEDLLLECAASAFPNLLANATTYIEHARDDDSFTDGNREDLTKPPRFRKAVVGAIATALRPGRAVQSSIQDNIWLKGDNLKLPRVKAVQDFLVDLLELNQP